MTAKNYSVNQLIDKIEHATTDELRAMLKSIVRIRHAPGTMLHLARIILDIEVIDERQNFCQLSNRRVIPYKVLHDLAGSPMMNFVDALVEAALQPDGPFQSREIMMRAAPNGAFFLSPDGISKSHKTQVGYILTMAGFERRSAYNKETRMPMKAWRLRDSRDKLTPKQRADAVRGIIRQELSKSGATPPEPKQITAEDLI